MGLVAGLILPELAGTNSRRRWSESWRLVDCTPLAPIRLVRIWLTGIGRYAPVIRQADGEINSSEGPNQTLTLGLTDLRSLQHETQPQLTRGEGVAAMLIYRVPTQTQKRVKLERKKALQLLSKGVSLLEEKGISKRLFVFPLVYL